MITVQDEIVKAKKRTDLFYLIAGLIFPALHIILGYYISGKRVEAPAMTEQTELLLYRFFFISMVGTIIALAIRWKLPRFFVKWALANRRGFGRSSGDQGFLDVAQSIAIIMFAFLEACTFYGLLLVFLGFDPGYIWIFVPFTVLGCLIVRPNEEFLRRLYDIYQERMAKSRE